MLKVEGLRSTENAVNTLDEGEHLWVKGIGDVLIYIRRVADASYRVSVCATQKLAKHFFVIKLIVDAEVKTAETMKLIKKLSARPCCIVKNNMVEEQHDLTPDVKTDLNYSDYVSLARSLGIKVQVNP